MGKYIFSLLFVVIGLSAFSQIKSDDVIGQYWTDTKEGKVEIFERDGKYFGKILWRKEVVKDKNNPEKALRDRSVIGIEFLKDFEFDGNKEWENGNVYSIDNGRTYSGKMWLEDEGKTLKMRGYIGFSWIGRTATLTRVD